MKDKSKPCQSIFFMGRGTERTGEFLWVDYEETLCEPFFKKFSEAAIKERVKEILQNKKYANQVLDDELEFIDDSSKYMIETFLCKKHTANYSIKVKKFKKAPLISEKDPHPFKTYFKEILQNTELSQPSTKQSGTLEEIFMWALLKEISTKAVNMKDQKMEIYTSDKYPLSYEQLLLLFQFLSYVSPDITKALEYITQPRLKAIGFPLKLMIAIYLDVVAEMSLTNLKLEAPKDELMVVRCVPNKWVSLNNLNSAEHIALYKNNLHSNEQKEVDQKRYKSATQFDYVRLNVVDESTDDMIEIVEKKNILKDFADHCNLNMRTLSKLMEPQDKIGKHKTGYPAIVIKEKKVNRPYSNQRVSTAVISKESKRSRMNLNKTITHDRASDLLAYNSNCNVPKVDLKKCDLLKLFRVSLRGRSAALSSKTRDVDISLNN